MHAKEIIDLLTARDQKGLALLYDHYSGALFGIIVRIVETEKVAEEILQQTFLKIWNKIELYDAEKSSLFTWMSQIARHTAIDARRVKRFQMDQKTESFDTALHSTGALHPDTSAIDVKSLLNRLDEKYRVILDCVYLEGHTHTEASEKLNLPVGTIKTRLRKALFDLRQVLQNEEGLFRQLILMLPFYFFLWN